MKNKNNLQLHSTARITLYFQNLYIKSPKIFTGIANGMAVVYSLAVIALPILCTFNVLSLAVLLLLFSLVFLGQSFLHISVCEMQKEKYEAELAKQEARINTINEQARLRLEGLVKEKDEWQKKNSIFFRTVQTKVKQAVYEMDQTDAVEKISKYSLQTIEEIINLLEAELTRINNTKVSVSIKVEDNKKYRTLCRGENCQISRAVIPTDKLGRAYPFSQNTALTKIIERGLAFFASEDLTREKAFRCEFDPQEWKQAFCSTVVMPIRINYYKNYRRNNSHYKVMGFLCIDAKTRNPRWKNSVFEKGMEYQVISVLCDHVFTLLNFRKMRIARVNSKQKNERKIEGN